MSKQNKEAIRIVKPYRVGGVTVNPSSVFPVDGHGFLTSTLDGASPKAEYLVREGYAEWVEKSADDEPQYTAKQLREAIEEIEKEIEDSYGHTGYVAGLETALEIFKKYNCEKKRRG